MKLSFEIEYYDSSKRVCQTSTSTLDWTEFQGIYQNLPLGLSFAVVEEVLPLGRRIRIPSSSLKETGSCLFKNIVFCLEALVRHEGDNGELLLPFDTGMTCKTSGKQNGEYLWPVFCEREWDIYWCNMAFYGCHADGKGYGVSIEDGKFDCILRLRTNFGANREYRIDPLFMIREWPDEKRLKDDLCLLVGEMPAENWRPLATWYKRYVRELRGIPSLAERCATNDALLYSTKALTVRCRLAVKQLPVQILEQKQGHEPPMRVYMDYNDVRAIAKKFSEYGIGPSEFCMVGWNYGGHDGAFPQLFPVCEQVGSEEDLRRACDEVNALGYRFNLHDNYYDAYTLASNLDLEDLCTSDMPYHMPVHGGGLLGGGRAYRLCGQRAVLYAQRNLAEVKRRLPNLSGAYFSDVISLIASCKCAHPTHPESRSENAAAYEKILRLQHEYYGVSSSEGGRDWSIPALDRAYMLINKPGNEAAYDYTDEAVPLYQTVYHGLLIYNIFRSGINTWPGSREYLLNLAYGGLPTLYYHHLFNPDWGASSGCKNDLNTTAEAIEADMPVIKRMSDDVKRIADLQLVDILSITQTDNTIDTAFENGAHIYTNLGDTEAVINGSTVPAHDFIVKTKE